MARASHQNPENPKGKHTGLSVRKAGRKTPAAAQGRAFKAPEVHRISAGRSMGWDSGRLTASLASALFVLPQVASSDEDLAKQLQNPVANLISVPFQLNYDQNIGPTDDGSLYTLNIEPVIPLGLNDTWNVISRTIIPLKWSDDVPAGSGSDFGFGDLTQSFFFSPKEPTSAGWIWGAGPVVLIPTSDDRRYGAGEWGLGPTAVALRQANGWTVGGLANHVWSVSGDKDVNATFLQPFVSYTNSDAWTFAVNTESTYDWNAEEWAVPINLTLSKVHTFGSQPVSFQVGVRHWADSTPGGPEGTGFRFNVTFLFPE